MVYQTLQVVYSQPEPPQKPKAKRTAQADMDPATSLSGNNLPRWIKDEFDSIIVPTVLEHYGAQQDPWKIDPQKATKANLIVADPSKSDLSIVDIVQQLIASIFPRRQYQLTSNDIIIKVVSYPATHAI